MSATLLNNKQVLWDRLFLLIKNGNLVDSRTTVAIVTDVFAFQGQRMSMTRKSLNTWPIETIVYIAQTVIFGIRLQILE